MLDGGNMGGAMGGHAGAGGFGGSGGNVDGGSGIGLDHSGPARGRGRGIGRRGPGRDTAYGRGAESERGTAQAMAAAYAELQDAFGHNMPGVGYAELQDAFGHNMPGVGYGRGFSRGSKGMPQHQRDSGWRAGQTLTDKNGNPVSLESLSWSRDDLLDDAKYEMWAQQNPDKVRNMPGMLGGLMNSLGLHDLSGAMTPAERGWDDSRWEGGPSDGHFANGLVNQDMLRVANDALRQRKHEQALAAEGGDNYDGRYERRNPRAYDEEARWDAQGGFGGGV